MQPQEGRRCSHLSNILAMLNTQINTPANSKMMTAAKSLITSSPTRDRYGSIKSIINFRVPMRARWSAGLADYAKIIDILGDISAESVGTISHP
jgi:hypothetical protein